MAEIRIGQVGAVRGGAPGRGLLDVKRSQTLWTDVFKGPQSLIAKGSWIDRPSIGIPYLYVDAGMTLAEALQALGQPEAAERVFRRAAEVAVATRIADEFNLYTAMPTPAPLGPPAAGDSAAGAPVPVAPTPSAPTPPPGG